MRILTILAACACVLLAQQAYAVENPSSWDVYNRSNSGLPNDRVFKTAVDRLGRVWVGCGGLTMFDGNSWKVFNEIGVLQIGVAADNTVWCASGLFSGALTHCDGTTITYYNSENSDLPSNWVQGVTVDNNNHVWAACAYTAMAEFDGTTWTKHLNAEEMGLGIFTLAHDRNNTIWVTKLDALMRYSNGEWTKIPVPGLSFENNDEITDIVCAADGSVWISTSKAGVGHYSNGTWTFYNTGNSDIPTNYIRATAVDSSGVLWLGSFQGLTSFDGSTWETRTKSNWVLPNDTISGIAVAPDNSLWVGTFGGLLHAAQSTTDVPEPEADPLGLVLAPNPAAGNDIMIRFTLPAPARTEIEVYTLTGDRAAVVDAADLPAGDHTYRFDTSALASGSYYCVIKTAGRITSRTALVINR